MGNGQSTLTCEQAVFTSIRTVRGEGYRLVAASRGLRPEERAEITRRSPSHGALDTDGPDAVGLMSYRLGSGRRCIAYVGHAGAEQTARGGLRVYTHLAVLDPQGSESPPVDPLHVHDVLGRTVEQTGPVLKPCPTLEPLTIPIGPAEPPARPTCPRETQWVWGLAAAMIEERPTILVGATEPLPVLGWALRCVPAEVHDRLDVSAGVRVSPTRGLRFMLVADDSGHLARRAPGCGVEVRRVDEEPPPPPAALTDWADLLRDGWAEDRCDQIHRLPSPPRPDTRSVEPAAVTPRPRPPDQPIVE